MKPASFLVAALTLATASVLTIGAATAKGERSALSGLWSGGGKVVLANGRQERARCRAKFSPLGSSASFLARCSTRSGTLNQAASLRRTGPNTYAGRFYNPRLKTSGQIHITVRGNRQRVSVRSKRGGAQITLQRRA
jgi:hypothetical protein